MGEPAGIGGEIALGAWLRRSQRALAPFFVIDSPDRLERLADELGWPVPIRRIEVPEAAPAVFDQALPVLPQSLPVPVEPGRPDRRASAAVIESLRRAADLAMAGRAAGIVTNPVEPDILTDAGLPGRSQAGFLATLANKNGGGEPVAMLVSPELRVVPVTNHLPLREAASTLSRDAIIRCAVTVVRALQRDFGIGSPRLSVAGLNPEAGNSGALGREEIDIIEPAVKALKRQGLAVDGPHPADSLFHPRARAGFDAALCMYHDQAQIPLKTLDFERRVKVSLGLPVVRTSPDHGTALAIAGKGIATVDSFIEALRLADRMAANRARRMAST